MKVLITGGTGFVGSHTAAELIRSGHDVRLLVRSQERVKASFSPLGIENIEDVVVGDVTDKDSIERAIKGADSVVHCASVYSFDSRQETTIKNTNVKGTEFVLGIAHQNGLDPIIHVSSFVSLLGNKDTVISQNSPVTKPPGVYFQSKAESDAIARSMQKSGAPVTITYPGSVWGPNDPHFGESCQIVKNILKGFYTFSSQGGFPLSDVRDIAKLHNVLMQPGQGARRYMTLATNISVKEVVNKISSITGRYLPVIQVPGWILLGPMRILDKIQLLLPFRLPFSYQLIYVPYLNNKVDDSLTKKDFNLVNWGIDKTITDTIRWMVNSGRISVRIAGNF